MSPNPPSSYRVSLRVGIPERMDAYGPVPPRVLKAVREAGYHPAPILRRGRRPAFDALLLTGGPTPCPPGMSSVPADRSGDNERDDREYALVDVATRAGVPILGVCRGMQLLALWAGGRLCEVETEAHFGPLGLREPVAHSVSLVPGSLLARLTGNTTISDCSSRHQQGVTVEGTSAEVIALAPDGAIEAIALGGAPACGVLWHPEDSPRLSLARSPMGLLDPHNWS